ncbi:MAG: endonuclease III [Rhodospirillaceae bacterium]|nr:endonuclease III [Rhodospirillaceae bacterium]|tara:strand:- start:925 stop:1578 length:654 start_codon:yes stop_codon:yes gene_type:complete
MIKLERASFISKKLNEIYPNIPIPLNHQNQFELLIAVLLSAQCTDERVNMVTPNLFAMAKNPSEMSELAVEEIYQVIRSCGLAPQKSRAISNLSKILIAKFDGEVPESFEHLEKLPGVGHKTASVVMSQGFGHPAFPVDTHIHRLAQRWRLTSGKNVTQTEKDLKRLFPQSSWNNLHLQIIYYGREHCRARSCFGLECIICKTCYPNRKKPIKTKKA